MVTPGPEATFVTERLALLEDILTDGLWDWSWEDDRVFFNKKWRQMLGLAADETAIRVEQWFERVHPDDLDWLDACIMETADGEIFELEYRIRPAAGHEWRWVLVRAVVMRDDQGATRRVVGVHSDITRRKAQEDALRRSEERYELSIRAIHDGLWDWDRTRDRVFYSARWNTMLGLPADAGDSRPEHWLGRVHPDDRPVLVAALEGGLDAESLIETEYRMRCATEDYRWFQCRAVVLRDAGGRVTRVVGCQADINQRKLEEERRQRELYIDPLTSLPNAQAMRDRMQALIDRTASGGPPCILVLVEPDRLREMTDNFGHHVGDAVMLELGRRILPTLPPGTMLARLGARFGIVVAGALGDREVVAIVNRCQGVLVTPVQVDTNEFFVTISAGIAVGTGDDIDAQGLLRGASTALTRARSKGRACEVFDAERHARVAERFELENELRRALGRGGEFEMFYQPIIRLATGRLAGFEALMRWKHPVNGLVSPARFIPIAEDSDMIVQLGNIALEQSVARLADWNLAFARDRPLFMSINVSGRQFVSDELSWMIGKLLAEHQVDPKLIKLEITESILMDDPAHTFDMLQALKEQDIKLSIDDFGTGYSSLSYLSRFPVDTLKIDQSFVGAMGEKSENAEIVRTIAALAHTLGLDIVAEGVEREADRASLVDLGCEFGQGWLFGRPLDADETRALLSRLGPDQRLVGRMLPVAAR
jgi:diguanylate cyclase (GGDEF)-like protein/PAS domain S-box-containing protein